MLFREEIFGCNTDTCTQLQINGWIWSGKSAEAVRLLHLIKMDRQQAMMEFETFLLSDPKKLLNSLDGSFALTYWNAEKRKGFLFKSLLCKHSLYVTSSSNEVSWSNNPLQICSQHYLDAIEKEYLLVACLEDSIPSTQSYYRGINRVPAGHIAFITEDDIQLTVVDTISINPSKKRIRCLTDLVQESRRLIESYTTNCLFGFSKVGVILSGGLDSCVALTSLKKLGFDVIGIHWSFADIPEADETNYAKAITTHLQVPLIRIDTTDIIASGDYLHTEWNFTAPYPHPFYRLFEKTLDICSEHGISVCSSGYFGDIIFGPNDPWKVNLKSVFRNIPFLDACKWLLEYWKIPKFQSRDTPHDRYFFYQSFLSNESKRRIEDGEIQVFQREKNSFLEQVLQSFDNETDSVLETHLYEKREIVPFHLYASRELLEFAQHIPLPYQMIPSGGQEYAKPILRGMYPDMPSIILTRNHRQIMNAVNEWYVMKNKDHILSLLSEDSYLAKCDIIEPIRLKHIAKDGKQWASSSSGIIRCCMVELWMQSLRRKWERRGKRNVIPIKPRYQME